MFDISMGSLFPELTSSAADSPASPTALPGSGKAATTSGTCGASLPESLATLGPAGWWLKTSPDSCPAPILLMAEGGADFSDEFSETWPKWGSMRNGAVSRLPPLGRTTYEGGCSSSPGMWPTPTVPNGGRAPKGGMSATGMTPDGKKRQVDLQHAARMRGTGMWPTPTVCGNHNRKGASPTSGDGLATVAAKPPQMWPTPAAQDGKNSTLPPSLRGRDSVPGAVMRWATPQARDYRTGQEERWDNPARSRNLNDQAGGALNPEFVAWLMGFPHGWLHFAHLGTPSSRSRRQSSGERSETRKRTAEPTE